MHENVVFQLVLLFKGCHLYNNYIPNMKFQISMAKFLKARTVHRSYHHITREVVESGMEEEHLRREVERLEGIFLTALFFSTKMGCLVQPQKSSVFVCFF